MDFQREGYCGLYCGACSVLLATEKRGLPAQTQIEQLSPDQVCFGCKSDKAAPWCTTCGIKQCAREKGLESCTQCAEIPCEQIHRFVEDPQWPYHLGVPKNWTLIRQMGSTEWLHNQDTRWRCPSCGTKFAWRDEICPGCGKTVSNYKADVGW